MRRVLVEGGHLPWGICPGEYRGFRDTLSFDEQIYTSLCIAQLE